MFAKTFSVGILYDQSNKEQPTGASIDVDSYPKYGTKMFGTTFLAFNLCLSFT